MGCWVTAPRPVPAECRALVLMAVSLMDASVRLRGEGVAKVQFSTREASRVKLRPSASSPRQGDIGPLTSVASLTQNVHSLNYTHNSAAHIRRIISGHLLMWFVVFCPSCLSHSQPFGQLMEHAVRRQQHSQFIVDVFVIVHVSETVCVCATNKYSFEAAAVWCVWLLSHRSPDTLRAVS